jgi:hypothetical protein
LIAKPRGGRQGVNTPSQSDAQSSPGHCQVGANPSGETVEEQQQQTQQTGGEEDNIARGSGGSETAPLAGAGDPHAGLGEATDVSGDGLSTDGTVDGENGNEAPNQAANGPNGPRIAVNTGAVDPGSIGLNAQINNNLGLTPWDAGYCVMEVDSRLQTLSAADRCLLSVYGDTIHMNDGRHLHGGIPAVEDKLWQRRWLQVVSVDLKLWIPPLGCADGKQFVNMLANKFQSVRLRQSNSERAMIFAPCILHYKPAVVAANAIKNKTIMHWLNLWEAGRFAELVQEVVISGRSGVAGRKPEELEFFSQHLQLVSFGWEDS